MNNSALKTSGVMLGGLLLLIGSPAWAQVIQQDFSIVNPTSKAKLWGTVYYPADAGADKKYPAVVFVPGGLGFGSSMVRGGQLRTLARAGFVVGCFDPDGRGKSEGKENWNGKIHQDGLHEFLKLVAGLDVADKNNLGVYSSSLGLALAAGTLARYPDDPPVKYFIDEEGPSDRFYITKFDNPRFLGNFEGHTTKDEDWWAEREAVRSIKDVHCAYLRLQKESDHVHGENKQHALDMIQAATNQKHGGKGKSPWVRINGPENKPNHVYTKDDSPQWLPDQRGRAGAEQRSEQMLRWIREMSGIHGASDLAKIKVDCARSTGTLSPYLFGSMAGPGFDKEAADLLKEAGFKVVEVNVPYPPRSSKDDKEKFDFAEIDRVVEHIHKIGAEPLFWFLLNRQPDDLDEFADYVRTLAKHVQDKFGKKGAVRLWRFGNEPDLDIYWRGTRKEYCETYATWAKTLKSVDPQFIVGGFSFCAALRDPKPGQGPAVASPPLSTLGSFAREVLDYCRDNKVPVDWFAFHAYGPVTYEDYHLQAKIIAAELKKYPKLSPLFGTPKMVNDEWNIKVGDAWSGEYDPVFDTVLTAAHNIMALSEMTEQGLWLSIRYGGASNAPTKNPQMPDIPRGRIRGDLSNGHDFPLVDGKGRGKPSYHAFKGFNMLSATPVMLASEGGDHLNLSVLAAKSEDDKTVILVVANYDVERAVNEMLGMRQMRLHQQNQLNRHLEARGIERISRYGKFSLTIDNLPWKGASTWERYAVDSQRRLELVERGVSQHKRFVSEGSMESPSVQIWVLRAAQENKESRIK